MIHGLERAVTATVYNDQKNALSTWTHCAREARMDHIKTKIAMIDMVKRL